MGISQILGQNESLPTATLRGVTDTKQSVTEDGVHLEGGGEWRTETGRRRDANNVRKRCVLLLFHILYNVQLNVNEKSY